MALLVPVAVGSKALGKSVPDGGGGGATAVNTCEAKTDVAAGAWSTSDGLSRTKASVSASTAAWKALGDWAAASGAMSATMKNVAPEARPTRASVPSGFAGIKD